MILTERLRLLATIKQKPCDICDGSGGFYSVTDEVMTCPNDHCPAYEKGMMKRLLDATFHEERDGTWAFMGVFTTGSIPLWAMELAHLSLDGIMTEWIMSQECSIGDSPRLIRSSAGSFEFQNRYGVVIGGGRSYREALNDTVQSFVEKGEG